jgi:hypothetical protein
VGWGLAAEARRENLTELAFGFRLTKGELTKIDGAYALLDIWNATKGAASTRPPDEPTCVKLADDVVDIQGVECWLTSELRWRHEPAAALWLSKRKGRAATWARRLVLGMSTRRSRIFRSLALLVVVVGALGFEGFVPRENLSSTTVAAALQSRLPADGFVDCNPRGDGVSASRIICRTPSGLAQQLPEL